MKKLIFTLVPLLLLSCGNKSVSTSESSMETNDSTEPNISIIETSTSTSTSEKFKLKYPSTFSLVSSQYGIEYSNCSIEFTSVVDCAIRWKEGSLNKTSHLIYTIEFDKNILYSFTWDQISFTEAKQEGDNETPSFLFECEYRYFSSDYKELHFETAGLMGSEDENGSQIILGKMVYDFTILE